MRYTFFRLAQGWKNTNKTHLREKYSHLFSDTSSSSSSEDSVDSSSDDNRKKTNISFSKQLGEISSGVELVKQKMNSWLQYSKKAIKNSDANTKIMLEKFLCLEMALQKSAADDKMFHQYILK